MLILLCGRSGVGKTTLCQAMEKEGFRIISASSVARQMYEDEYGRSPDRVDLAKYGDLILNTMRERAFSRRMEAALQEALASQDVLIDGLRSPVAVRRIKQKLNASLIFLRRGVRTDELFGDTTLVDALNRVDSRLGCIETMSDGYIENESSVQNMKAALLVIVGEPG